MPLAVAPLPRPGGICLRSCESPTRLAPVAVPWLGQGGPAWVRLEIKVVASGRPPEADTTPYDVQCINGVHGIDPAPAVVRTILCGGRTRICTLAVVQPPDAPVAIVRVEFAVGAKAFRGAPLEAKVHMVAVLALLTAVRPTPVEV